MAYYQPALAYFDHDMPYERGRCERCVCATSFGAQCKRATCRHRKCCWQHARPENALFPSLTSYEEATSDRDARIGIAKREFHQAQYNRVVDRLRTLYRKVGETARGRVLKLEALQDAYHDAHKRGDLHLANLVVAGFQPPPRGLDAVDISTPDLHRRLLRYWNFHAESENDSFSNDFSEMSTGELLAIVRVGDAYCLSYSENQGLSDFIHYWQSRLDAGLPVISPWNRAPLSDDELDAILAVARRLKPALQRPVRKPPPEYVDSSFLRVHNLFATVSGELVPFFRVELISRPRGGEVGLIIRSIGLIPDIAATDDQYTSGATIVAGIERLWRHHRLFKVEPASGFVTAFTPSCLSVDLFKNVAHWIVWSQEHGRVVINMRLLGQMATEVRDAVQGLPP